MPLSPHQPTDGAARCHDCGVEPGGLHHLGCDVQRCPSCGDQLICCDCPWDEFALSRALSKPPERAPDLVPLGAAAAPFRARYVDDIRSVAAWALKQGRTCDLDVCAVCLRRSNVIELPPATCCSGQTCNTCCGATSTNLLTRTLVPDDWHVHLWTVLSWLDAS